MQTLLASRRPAGDTSRWSRSSSPRTKRGCATATYRSTRSSQPSSDVPGGHLGRASSTRSLTCRCGCRPSFSRDCDPAGRNRGAFESCRTEQAVRATLARLEGDRPRPLTFESKRCAPRRARGGHEPPRVRDTGVALGRCGSPPTRTDRRPRLDTGYCVSALAAARRLRRRPRRASDRPARAMDHAVSSVAPTQRVSQTAPGRL